MPQFLSNSTYACKLGYDSVQHCICSTGMILRLTLSLASNFKSVSLPLLGQAQHVVYSTVLSKTVDFSNDHITALVQPNLKVM